MKNNDPMLREFETKDLGDDIVASGVTPVAIRPKQRATSFVLSDVLKAKLRKKAEKRGIGYQTLAKIILAEHVDDY